MGLFALIHDLVSSAAPSDNVGSVTPSNNVGSVAPIDNMGSVASIDNVGSVADKVAFSVKGSERYYHFEISMRLCRYPR